MAADDDMSELNTQDRPQAAVDAEQPTTVKHETGMADSEQLESRNTTEQLDVKQLPAITAPPMKHQELTMPPSLPPNSGPEEMGNTTIALQPPFAMGAEANEHTTVELAPNNQDHLQGIPHNLEATGSANSHGKHHSASGMDDGHQTDQTAQGEQENETASDVESDEVDEPAQPRRDRRVPDEDEEEESEDGEYSDDGSRDSEDEDADEDEEKDIAEFQSKLKRSVAQRTPSQKSSWNSRHELFEDDGDVQEVPRQEFDRNLSGQPRSKQDSGFNGYGGPQQVQQQPMPMYDPHAMGPFSGGMFGGRQSSSFMSGSQPGMHQNHPMTTNAYQFLAHMPVGPHAPQQFAPAFPLNGPPQRQHAMSGFQDPRFHHYGQLPAQSGYTNLSMSPFEAPGSGFVPPPPNHQQLHARGVATVRNGQQRGQAKKQVSEEDSYSSEDDVPLRERMEHHFPQVSDAVEDSSTPAPKTAKRGKQQKQDSDSDVEEVSSQVKAKPNMGFKTPKSTKAAAAAPKKSTAPAQPAPTPQAQPDIQAQAQDQASQPTIDWKLPRYDVKFEPPKTKDDPTVAKISIPNLVREELLLSPDHASQEAHLLLHIFIPAHQALSMPDPEPAIAALNFHTIALMVIEAFVQFEIGDEYGTGRGHWHNAHDQSDVDYLRQRSAKDADTDEIFFAVIDRWRAGIESGKESAKMIRGVQEFCDLALDVIYYIKENGLLKERKNAWEEKGGKKGAKKVEEDDSEEQGFSAVAKGKKRGAQVNEVKARKKTKASTKKAEPKVTVKPAKKKTSAGAVTVVRRKR